MFKAVQFIVLVTIASFQWLFYHRLYEDNPDDSIQKCALLLDEPSLDTAVRVGDVYGMMIEHYAQTGNHKKVSSTV